MFRFLKTVTAVLTAVILVSSARGDTGIKRVNALDIDIWVNKGDGATYYFGEDVAVYFRASDDCYVVIYDIDPAGNVSLLYPTDYDSDSFVRGGEVYRIPGYDDSYRLEVTGPSGKEFIHAVASYDYIEPPDFIRYEFYEYGNWDYYYDDFVHSMNGEMAVFVEDLNNRIVNGPYVTASVAFYIDDRYRHHRWYRHWYIEPYYLGSVWVGSSFPGCEVWIDGYYYGIAPILIPSIYIGRHWLWMYYNGYPVWQDYVYVRSGQRYFVDAKIKRRYRDFDYGRSRLDKWRFYQKKHRNEQDFKRRLSEYHDKRETKRPRAPIHIQKRYSSKYKDPARKAVDQVKRETVYRKEIGKSLRKYDKRNEETRTKYRKIRKSTTESEQKYKGKRKQGTRDKKTIKKDRPSNKQSKSISKGPRKNLQRTTGRPTMNRGGGQRSGQPTGRRGKR